MTQDAERRSQLTLGNFTLPHRVGPAAVHRGTGRRVSSQPGHHPAARQHWDTPALQAPALLDTPASRAAARWRRAGADRVLCRRPARAGADTRPDGRAQGPHLGRQEDAVNPHPMPPSTSESIILPFSLASLQAKTRILTTAQRRLHDESRF
ncbi:hypothetical protein L1887_58164 [Cichorium endivia]|nr:hypothetical protein L1887_58164 [Cichorium endivia]